MILPAIGLAAALLAPHTSFAVIVNGGATVTRQPLTVHQVITCHGVAHTVELVKVSGGTYEIVLAPRLPASALCST